MGYDENQIKVLNKRMYECMAHKTAHLMSAQKFNLYEKLVGIPQIILTSVMSSISISQASESDTEGTKTKKVAIAVLSCVITILTGVNKIYDFQKRKGQHLKMNGMFGSLERRISSELIKTNKQEFDIFCEDVNGEYNKLRNESPIYPIGVDYNFILSDVIENDKNKFNFL